MRKHCTGSWLGAMTAVAALAAAPRALAVEHVVQVGNNFFAPQVVNAAPGDTIKWVWVAGNHTVTSGAPCTFDNLYFDQNISSTSPEFTWVVPTGDASIPYFCRPHCGFGQTGTINVSSGAVEMFTITLDGDQESPTPVNTAATGTGTATLDRGTNLLTWNIAFSGLSSNQTAAHFHGPALPCANAGVVIGFPLGSPIVGQQQLTAAQAQAVLEGRWYANIHSVNFPGGEIRGQVNPVALQDPIPALIPTGDRRLRLRTLADGLSAPNWGTYIPGDASRLFVVDQVGTLWEINVNTGAKRVFLDVAARLVPLGVFGPGTFDERGFLGAAFHPNYAANGKLYTYTSEPVAGVSDFPIAGVAPNHHSVIAEWTVPSPGDPNSVVDPASRRELMRFDEPQFNHNAGCLAFGPDGNLYIAVGDGGGADDRDGQAFIGAKIAGHGCSGNGRNIQRVLGKMLRIDPLGNNSANGKYGNPASNPYVGVSGLDEIYCIGLRNPFRFSFDQMMGTMYIGDVGQNDIEEINIGALGADFGWPAKEGTFKFIFNGNQGGYVTDRPEFFVPAGLTDPIAQYDHDDGLSAIGGFVYHGSRIPDLQGTYVFGEFAKTFSNDGRLLYLGEHPHPADGGPMEVFEFVIQSPTSTLARSVLGFGQDAGGEVYVMVNSTGTPSGATGAVLALRSPAGDMDCDGDVDFGDIDPFVLALQGQAAYEAQYPDCAWGNGDTDGNDTVNFGDIDPFVALIGS